MFRVKVSVSLALIILVTTLLVYLLVPGRIEEALQEGAAHSLEIGATSLERGERLDDFSVVSKATAVADFSGLKTALTDEYSGNYEYQRHLGVYNKGMLRWQFVFDDIKKANDASRDIELPLEERRPFQPDLVFVTDERGNGVAAMGKDKYEWYNVDVAKEQPTLLKAQLGKPVKDIWVWKWNQSDNTDMYRVGMAPVMQGSEKLIGVAVVGTLINDGVAQAASAEVEGLPVAYFVNGHIYASTLKPDDDESLAKQLFEEHKVDDSGGEPEAIRVTIGGEEYLAIVRYHAGNGSDTRSGFVVLANLDSELALANSVRTYTPLVGLLVLLLTIGLFVAFTQQYNKGFEEIDKGIQEVIAGNKELEFTVSSGESAHREMARSLNLMSAFLQGKIMPDEVEEGGGDWGDLMVEDVSATSMMRAIHAEKLKEGSKPVVSGVALPGMPGSNKPLPTAVERDTADRVLFEEYIEAKKNLGEDISDLDLDGFLKRLTKNRAQLKKKHNARDIEFTVVVREGKVVLKPQPIL